MSGCLHFDEGRRWIRLSEMKSASAETCRPFTFYLRIEASLLASEAVVALACPERGVSTKACSSVSTMPAPARHRRAAGSLAHRARRPPHRRHEYRGDGGAHRHQAGDGEDTSAPGPHTPKARDGKACRSSHGRCLPVRGPAAASCAGKVTHPREPPRRLHCAATRCTAVPPASSI